jgi:hypothetical protein
MPPNLQPSRPPRVTPSTGDDENIEPIFNDLPARLPARLHNPRYIDTAPPLKCEHFFWKCKLNGPRGSLQVNALIDSGAHMVLIRPSIATTLGLQLSALPTPEHVNVAISPSGSSRAITHYVKLNPETIDKTFRSETVHAVVAKDLCVPLILGLPFLVTNRITCDYALRECTVIVDNMAINLLASAQNTSGILQQRF